MVVKIFFLKMLKATQGVKKKVVFKKGESVENEGGTWRVFKKGECVQKGGNVRRKKGRNWKCEKKKGGGYWKGTEKFILFFGNARGNPGG